MLCTHIRFILIKIHNYSGIKCMYLLCELCAFFVICIIISVSRVFLSWCLALPSWKKAVRIAMRGCWAMPLGYLHCLQQVSMRKDGYKQQRQQRHANWKECEIKMICFWLWIYLPAQKLVILQRAICFWRDQKAEAAQLTSPCWTLGSAARLVSSDAGSISECCRQLKRSLTPPVEQRNRPNYMAETIKQKVRLWGPPAPQGSCFSI